MALFKGKAFQQSLPQENPKTVPQFKGLSIGKILWAGFLVVAIVTLLSGYSSYLLYAERVDDNRDAEQRAIAERAVTTFAVRFETLSQQIERILILDAVQSALDRLPAGETTPPDLLQERLAEQLPHLIRQLIIDPDTLPNGQVKPPLSYACLELASQPKAILELHRFGTADQHLDIAFSINNNRSLLLSFEPSLVHQWLTGIDSGGSYIVLQQQIESHEPLAFGQTGNVGLAGNRNSIIHPIPDTKFQIAVTLPKVQPLAQIERLLFFVNFGVTLVLVALILWATLGTIRAVLRRDLNTISSLIKRPAISIHHILPIKLAELRGCAEEIKFALVGNEPEPAAEQRAKPTESEAVPPLSQTHITVNVEPGPERETQPKEEAK